MCSLFREPNVPGISALWNLPKWTWTKIWDVRVLVVVPNELSLQLPSIQKIKKIKIVTTDRQVARKLGKKLSGTADKSQR